jgi:hypothetical protein
MVSLIPDFILLPLSLNSLITIFFLENAVYCVCF